MLTSKKIAYLKALSHHKKPIVTIGNKGLTESVLNEIHVGLKAHELIKIRIRELNKDKRDEQCLQIQKKLGTEIIHQIGFIVVFYRLNLKKT